MPRLPPSNPCALVELPRKAEKQRGHACATLWPGNANGSVHHSKADLKVDLYVTSKADLKVGLYATRRC